MEHVSDALPLSVRILTAFKLSHNRADLKHRFEPLLDEIKQLDHETRNMYREWYANKLRELEK